VVDSADAGSPQRRRGGGQLGAELRSCAERGLGPQPILHHLARATDALCSVLFAVNRVYDPADKRAMRTVVESPDVV
jgi:hypothetical protein